MTGTAIEQSPHRDPAAPWKRRPKEPAAAYAAFVVYRDQDPPRSLRRCAAAMGRGVRQLNEWSRLWGWVERSDAWTAHLVALADTVTEEEVVRRRREEAERLYTIGHDLQTAGHFRLTGATDSQGKTTVQGIHPDELDPDQVARFLELGTKLVRLSMGLPTDFTGVVQVSLPDLQRILGGFLELAEKRMGELEHEALVADCYALVRETLGEAG